MRTFNQQEEAEVIKQGFKFQGAQHNGKLFERVRGGLIEGRIVRPDGIIMKTLPYEPQSTVERQRWGL